jgi:hypothetical protein
MQKKCSHCALDLPVEDFSRHPTAKHGRKHICKKCDKIYSDARYAKISKQNGVKKKERPSVITEVSSVKQGYIREDGLVFWSKTKISNGYREWWVTKEHFDKMLTKRRELGRTRYHTIPALKNINKSERARKAKKKWKDGNPEYFANFHGKRRASIRGDRTILTAHEKAQVLDIYKFRDCLNKRHQRVMFEVDHIKAVSRGGCHTPSNLRVTTKEFNRQKWAN